MIALEKLSKKLQKFGKENLSDIMHFTATGLKENFECQMVRIYLEDLYEGMLICHYVTDQNQTDQKTITQFISPKASIISQAFYENSATASWDLDGSFADFRSPFEKFSGIQATAAFPITHQLRPIGAVSLDWGASGTFLNQNQMEAIASFFSTNSGIIDRAKRFHQKISFSKHLDLARKKEAAWMMVRSAVKLIDKLSLASVLAPVTSQISQKSSGTFSDLVEVLAVYSKNAEDATVYRTKDQMSILNDQNLLNKIVKYDPEIGLFAREPMQESVYIADVREEKFRRRAIARKLDLVSLYQIPKFDKKTGQFICALNYYTNTPYKFNRFEKRLLEEHASMVENLIQDEGREHIEIEVLSECEELVSEHDESLQTFLLKILDKTSELIGADGGTISILKMIKGKPWLVVEDEKGKLVGAKSRGWKKSKIPPLPVGGKEILPEMRSLTGYCAHLARPILVNSIQDLSQTDGFYKNLSPSIRSELAVPIISGNSVLGVINQDSFRNNYFTEENKNILQIIAGLISQKVYNLKQIEDLRLEINHFRKDIEYRDPNVSSYHFGNIIGKSQIIHSLIDQINTVVESICNRMLHWGKLEQRETMMGLPALLITGKTGCGKEFFFNNIYSRLVEIFQTEKGTNFKLPLKKTNIAAYSGELTYSELFGHKKGAYTGAEAHRQGILEEANGGVVFLDEIGDADPKTQVQLLRFLDTGVFLRLGENEPQYSRIFLIAATNKNLLEEIEKGRFREDLYHRLNELHFQIPSLNERKEDIEDLAIHFLGKLFNTYKKEGLDESSPYLDKEALEFLKSYDFRGNVRELRNILLRALLFRKGAAISRQDISNVCQAQIIDATPDNGSSIPRLPADGVLEKLEKGHGDFWSEIHRPFKNKEMTRDMIKNIILTARSRYHTNFPGLAIKLRACDHQFRGDPDEMKKFVSFKNFLYKTVKITSD